MQKQKYSGYLIVIVLLIMFLGNFRTYLVLGESDLPNFSSGDKVIVNRSAYDITIPFSNAKLLSLQDPERGDMILCHLKKKNNGDFWLKRIIGLPGDTISIRQNKILINGTPLKYEVLNKESISKSVSKSIAGILALESGYGLNHMVTYSETKNIISDYGPMIINEDHYFVLGDNRANSLDSRFLGLVPRDKIFGKYIFRIYHKG